MNATPSCSTISTMSYPAYSPIIAPPSKTGIYVHGTTQPTTRAHSRTSTHNNRPSGWCAEAAKTTVPPTDGRAPPVMHHVRSGAWGRGIGPVVKTPTFSRLRVLEDDCADLLSILNRARYLPHSSAPRSAHDDPVAAAAPAAVTTGAAQRPPPRISSDPPMWPEGRRIARTNRPSPSVEACLQDALPHTYTAAAETPTRRVNLSADATRLTIPEENEEMYIRADQRSSVSPTFTQIMREVERLLQLGESSTEPVRAAASLAPPPPLPAAPTPTTAELPVAETEDPVGDDDDDDPLAHTASPSANPIEAEEARSAEDDGRRRLCEVVAVEALKWATFGVESRQTQLRRIAAFDTTTTGTDAAASPLHRGNTAFAKLLNALEHARVSLCCLQTTVAHVVEPPPTTQPDEEDSLRQLCTSISNALSASTVEDDNVLAQLLNKLADSRSAPQLAAVARDDDHDDHDGDGATTSVQAALEEVRRSSERDYAARGSREDVYLKELKATALLLQQVNEANLVLEHDVQLANARAEKCQRKSERIRRQKDEIAHHYDVLSQENAELLARVHNSRSETSQPNAHDARSASRGGAARSPSRAEDDRLALAAVQEEYRILQAQCERQSVHLREFREKMKAADAESEGLRGTILQLRDALSRHRSVIELLSQNGQGGTSLDGVSTRLLYSPAKMEELLGNSHPPY